MAITNITPNTVIKNYISNTTFEGDVSGYVTYADGAAIPVDGTGGSPTLTFAVSATSPLRGIKSGLITAGALGNGVSYDFTIDSADKGKTLTIAFDYAIASGTMVTGDYAVYVYDVTNSQMIQPYGYQIPSVTQGAFLATFPTNSNSTSYRLIIHQVVSSTANIKIDNVSVSAQQALQGMAGSDWQSYSLVVGATTTAPTLGTNTSSAMWRRVGDSMEIRYTLSQTAGGSAGSGTYLFPLPAGYSLDTSKITVSTTGNGAGGSIVGIARAAETTASNTADTAFGNVIPYNSTNLAIYDNAGTSAAQTPLSSSHYSLGFSPTYITFTALVPIAGWSSNVTMGQSSTFRISSYLANGTRVTGSAPTALGQYRSYLRNASSLSFTETSGAPTAAPSASNGMAFYATTAYGTGDSSGQPSKYEIFVGKNKTVNFQFYNSTGLTGYINVSPLLSSTGGSYGVYTNYDPTTGIATVLKNVTAAGPLAMGVDATGSGLTTSPIYFDIIVSENALAVGIQAPRSEVRLDTYAGYGSTDTKVIQFTNSTITGTAFTVTSNSTNGTFVTINEDGVYGGYFTFGSPSGSGTAAGVTLNANSSDRTTNATSLSNSVRIGYALSNGVASQTTAPSAPFKKILRVGDVIRFQSNSGVPSTAADAVAYIVKESN